MSELNKIEKYQKNLFQFKEIYMTPEMYYRKIEQRKISFMVQWQTQDWRSWNYADYCAFKKLSETNPELVIN